MVFQTHYRQTVTDNMPSSEFQYNCNLRDRKEHVAKRPLKLNESKKRKMFKNMDVYECTNDVNCCRKDES